MRNYYHPRRRFVFSLFLVATLASGLSGGLLYYWYWYDLDLVIAGGLVVDGTARAPRRGDVAIRGGRIAGVSRWLYRWAPALVRINARDRVVAPGFIDVHTHIEPNLPARSAFKPANFLKQGVTTLITGNCGRSRTDVSVMLDTLDRLGSYANVATLVGHNSVRRQVMGTDARPPDLHELRQMQQIVTRGMREGAFGFSTGLAYAPGRFAMIDELIALARAAAERGGVYASHIRNEGSRGEEAIEEALAVGRQAGAVTQISHLKSAGRGQWRSMARRLKMLAQARAAGLHVYSDAYPYECSSTTTDILLPDWAVADNRANLRQVAGNQVLRQRLRDDILSKLQADGWRNLTHVSLVAGRQEWIGRTLAEAPTSAATTEQQIENLIAISLRGGAQAIYADMDEADVAAVLTDDFSVFGSDSGVRDPEGDYRPHPRGVGTFPRIFKIYVRETGRLDLPRAVRKASGMAAEIFGIEGRGHLVAGEWADVVIFDPTAIEDRADYEQPFAEPRGIDYVIVNGVVVVAHGSFTEHLPAGRALRHAPMLSDIR
jgi:N-acyl-D-aspartate/D-glutamate deacylase